MTGTAMADTPAPLTLEGHGITLELTPSADIDGFVAAANARAHIKGLADTLNPGIIDPARLKSLVAALPAQPDAVKAQLAGHILSVDSTGFGVLAIEPARPDAFGPTYKLTIERLAGVHVLAHASVPMDAKLAQALTHQAEAATHAAEKSATAAEKGHPDPDGLDISGTRWRRAQAARGWMISAMAWHAAAPADAAAKKASADALKAASKYQMPSGGNV